MEVRVEGIVLAAGLSTRMGKAKLLLEIDGLALVMWVVRAALESALDRIVLVTGPSDPLLEAALRPVFDHPKFSRVVNPHPELGMSTSLVVGVAEVRTEAAGVLIMLADQPWLTAGIINELLAVFETDPSRIVVPSVQGRRTTPVLFPASLRPDLLRTTGDVGGREVVNRNSSRVVQVEMGPRYDDSDVDTPEDMRILKARRGSDRGETG
jgi:molybdenum cofactor cytidylyltransferase